MIRTLAASIVLTWSWAANAQSLNPPNPTQWVMMAITYQDGHIDFTEHVPDWFCGSRAPLLLHHSKGNRDQLLSSDKPIDPASLAIAINCEPE